MQWSLSDAAGLGMQCNIDQLPIALSMNAIILTRSDTIMLRFCHADVANIVQSSCRMLMPMVSLDCWQSA